MNAKVDIETDPEVDQETLDWEIEEAARKDHEKK